MARLEIFSGRNLTANAGTLERVAFLIEIKTSGRFGENAV
jgi:hypothetical protein